MSNPTSAFFATFLTLALATGLGACGGSERIGGFSAVFPDNQPEPVGRVNAALKESPRSEAPAIAVLANTSPSELAAFDLATGTRRWSVRPAALKSGAFIAGHLVITREGDDVVGRDLMSGAERLREDTDGLSLLSADGEGADAAIVLSGGSTGGGRLLIVRGGAIRDDRDVDQTVGAAVLRAGHVFFPWGNQNLSVLDAGSGEEVARTRVTDEVVTAALTDGRDVFAAGAKLATWDRPSQGAGAPPTFALSAGDLPGTPPLARAARGPVGAAGAAHSVQLAWRPSLTDGAVSTSDRVAYLTYYRAVFALDGGERRARWAALLPADAVGAEAITGGVLLADSRGAVSFRSAATGAELWRKDLGMRATSATFAGGAPVSAREGDASPGAAAALAEIASAVDARLVAAQAFAVDLVANVRDASVTGHLISLAENRRLPRAVRDRASAALSARTNGEEEVMFALTRHASFLEGTVAPPVGALAQAAVGMGAKEALPLLLEHLADPNTPSEELPRLVDAIGRVGDRSAANPVRDFTRLYHADEWEVDLAQALGTAVGVYARLAGPAARATLEELIADPASMQEVLRAATAELKRLDDEAKASAPPAPKAAADAGPTEATASSAGTGAPVASPPTPGSTAPAADPEASLPTSISHAMSDAALAPVLSDLIACARKVKGPIRLVLLVNADGSVERSTVTPLAAEACALPRVAAVSFPRTRSLRPHQVIRTISP